MKFSTVAVLLVAFAMLATPIVAEQAQRRCKALVLQSGGDLGAYEVGALKGMYESLPAGSLEYDVISGIIIHTYYYISIYALLYTNTHNIRLYFSSIKPVSQSLSLLLQFLGSLIIIVCPFVCIFYSQNPLLKT